MRSRAQNPVLSVDVVEFDHSISEGRWKANDRAGERAGYVEPLDCSDACVQIAMRLVGELVGGLRFAPFSALGLAASTFGAYQEPPAPGLSAERGWVAQEFPVTGSTRGAIFEFMCSEVMLACAEAGVSAVATVFLPKTRGTGIRLGFEDALAGRVLVRLLSGERAAGFAMEIKPSQRIATIRSNRDRTLAILGRRGVSVERMPEILVARLRRVGSTFDCQY